MEKKDCMCRTHAAKEFENAILHEIKPKGRFWLQNNCEESVINRQIWVEKPHRGPRRLVNAWNFASFTQGTKK